MVMRMCMLGCLAIGVVLFRIGLPNEVIAQGKPRTGAITGVVLNKGNIMDGRNAWVEVKADGEEKGRRHSPVADPMVGGPNREILAAIRKVGIGDRVRFEWIDAGDGKDITKFEVLKPKK